MAVELDFIPFHVSPLPEGPWLVFAPHADDETFGMGGSLILAREQQIETHLVVLTDGALGGSAPDLVARRQQELASAVDYLGIRSCQCWDQPDRQLQPSPDLHSRAREAIQHCGARAVFFPAAYEPHPDHRATAQLVWQTLAGMYQRTGQTPAAIAYEIGVQSPINTMIDITPVMAQKREAIALYSSQNAENCYPDLISALNRSRTFSLPDEVR
ncbi:MAG: PIG-L deacetylase family protein, partial [Gammaproteobacteria bacterium]